MLRSILPGKTARVVALLFLGGAFLGGAAFVSTAQQPVPGPALTVTSREVLLDVVVTDRAHRPVTGLTAKDFIITEEGQAQAIRHLEEHTTLSDADVAKLKTVPQLPPNTFTNYAPVIRSSAFTVILLDMLDTPASMQGSLYRQLIAFLREKQSSVPIAIFRLDTEMRMVQGFSTDRQVLLAAAENSRKMSPAQSPVFGGGYDVRSQKSIRTYGLKAIGRYLSAYPGRKNLIWLTGALPALLIDIPRMKGEEQRIGKVFQDNSIVFNDKTGEFTDALRLSRVAIYPIDTSIPPPVEMESIGPTGGGFRPPSPPGRGNLGTVSGPDGVHTYSGEGNADIEKLAQATGGKAYNHTRGLKNSLAEIVDNGSNYYSLGYVTTNQNWQGEFRSIQVSVDRPGVELQYRPGYFATDRSRQELRQLLALKEKMGLASQQAYTPQPAVTSENAVANKAGIVVRRPRAGFDAAMDLGAVPPTEIVFTAHVAMDNNVVKLGKEDSLPADNFLNSEYKDKSFRNFAINIQADAHSLNLMQAEDRRWHDNLQFVTALYTREGKLINSIASNLLFNATDSFYREALLQGVLIHQQIAIPVKGDYFLRIGIHDLSNDHMGALEIPVKEVQPGIALSIASTH